MKPFDPALIDAFAFDDIAIEWAVGAVSVRFGYRLDDADGVAVLRCAERFEIPLPEGVIPPERVAAFERLLLHLGLVAGLSYYKLAAPDRVLVQVGEWSASAIDDHRAILANGLGEYCFVNGLDPDLRPVFEFRAPAAAASPVALDLQRGPLVPVGGGKDSCVSVEALRASGMNPTLITVNRYPVIAEVIADAGLPDIAVRRILDPQLPGLNASGARNGHVPATAIVSLAVCATAVLHGHRAVVMSNERSASEANVSYRGVEINHQWSKSEQAEAVLQRLVSSAAPGLAYFSLLRPLSELAIARRFARTCTRYFDSFSSCNAAFRLDPARRVSRWCGTCPKCQFVFLALATVLDRGTLEGIVGSDVFAGSSIEGFRALLGLTPWKPFECVGESLECRVAVTIVAERPEWREHPVLRVLVDELRAHGVLPEAADRVAVFASIDAPATPPAFADVLSADIGGGEQ